jgi:hypothetical protein
MAVGYLIGIGILLIASPLVPFIACSFLSTSCVVLGWLALPALLFLLPIGVLLLFGGLFGMLMWKMAEKKARANNDP